MRIAVRSGGVTKPVAKPRVVTGGVTKAVSRIWLRTHGALKQVFSAFSVWTSSDSTVGYGNASFPVNLVTLVVQVYVSGAVGAVTYTWTRTDGGAHPWTITNPTPDTVSFHSTVAAGTTETATFHCTVADTAGQTLTTANVSASLTNMHG